MSGETDLVAAIDALVEFVKSNQHIALYEPDAGYQYLCELDATVGGLCGVKGQAIPDGGGEFGNTKIPAARLAGPGGVYWAISPSPIWVQAMRSLRVMAAHVPGGGTASNGTDGKPVPVVMPYLRDGQLFVENEPFRLTDPESNVLDAIAVHGAMEKGDLENKSGRPDAVAILKRLREKYAALKIRIPGGKGKGGYWANVKGRDDSVTD